MYTKVPNSLAIIRDEDGAYIPNDVENVDYVAFLKWQADGNVPADPPVVTPPVPSVVTRLQGRLALSRAGLLDTVESAVAAAGGEIAIWYADAQTWHRDDPIFQQLAGQLGMTDVQLDSLFAAAASI